jgi:aspartate/methionine/tyrosine aminotransferase
LERLEVIADTFLSMNAPVQRALPQWMHGRRRIQEQILDRVKANLAVLDQALAEQTLMSRLQIEAGWYAVLRIPAAQSDAETAIHLLVDHGIAIHSGGFFGFSQSGWLVASLLGRESEFSYGISGLARHLQRLHE